MAGALIKRSRHGSEMSLTESTLRKLYTLSLAEKQYRSYGTLSSIGNDSAALQSLYHDDYAPEL